MAIAPAKNPLNCHGFKNRVFYEHTGLLPLIRPKNPVYLIINGYFDRKVYSIAPQSNPAQQTADIRYYFNLRR